MDIGRIKWLGWLTVSLLACGDEAPVTGTAESSSTGGESSSSSTTSADASSEGSSSTGVTTVTTSTAESSSSDGSTGSSSEGGSTDSSSSEGSSSGVAESSSSTEAMDTVSEESSTGGAMCGGLPNGSACGDDCECNSDACYVVGILGGLCGECLVDADCPIGGCTVPSSLANPPEGAVCNDGSLGDGCQTDGVCQDPLVCVEIIDVPGVITNTTCSECATDADCGAQLCSPEYDIIALGGDWICVDAGSVPDGSGCDFEGSGDTACASGRCAIADVMGLLELGVCGPCEDDGDCPLGTCHPPEVDLMMGLVPSYCE